METIMWLSVIQIDDAKKKREITSKVSVNSINKAIED